MSSSPTVAPAPTADKVRTVRTRHGDEFVDNYEWLRDKDSPQVRAHLAAENAYTEAVTAGQEPLRRDIFNEIKSRTQETDLSVPSRKGDWWYYGRTVEGSQYPIHCRVAAETTGDLARDWTPPAVTAGTPVPGEVILLDGNAEAEGQPFFSLGAVTISEDGNLLAYSVDNAGDERFTLHVKDLRTGELLADTVDNVFYGAVFSPDGNNLFYTVVDEAWRPYQVIAHRLGTPVSADVVVHQEDDPALWTSFELSADKRFLLIDIGCSEFSEVRTLDLGGGDLVPRTVIPRSERLLYEAEPVLLDGTEKLLLTHNRDAVNSMISLVEATELARPVTEQRWATVLAHDEAVRVNGIALTATHLAIAVRKDTIEGVQFLPLAGLGSAAQQPPAEPVFDEELYTCGLAGAEHEAPLVRLVYTSFLSPERIYDYVLDGGELSLRKERPVPGRFNRGDYLAERQWATAADGTRIPLSVIRRADLARDGSNPALVYGYGSYEVSMDPTFGVARLSLLDRGIIFVIAHVRGGGEMGRAWYENGKKLAKMNSFTDFIAATEHTARSGWVDPARIAAMGGSAGGLLMGAVANLAPEKYCAILAQVPFVDALTSILDPDLPLSALEWEEWGNPIEDAAVYAYMKSYTPYENVRALDYPRIAAVTSFNDTRVLYVEPAKWVAQLRETGTGAEPIMLKTEMDGGHGGASGRYEGWKDIAWDYAFIADSLGCGASAT